MSGKKTNGHSVSALDLSLSPLAPPLKHPAFASIEELQSLQFRRRPPVRHRSIPVEWQTSGYVSYTENGENAALKSLLQRRGSLTKSGRRAYRNGSFVQQQQQQSNSSESDSSLEPRHRSASEQWNSSSFTFLSTSGVPTPQIRRRHLNCYFPEMEDPKNKKRLHKSPSVDSGNSSTGNGGSFPRIKSKSPSKKRYGSGGSTSSSSSLGSLKERLESTEPVAVPPPPVVKKRTSLAALINRKSSDKKTSSSSNSGAASNEDEGIEVKSGPSSPIPPAVTSSSSSSSSKVSSIRESLKNALRRSSSNSKLNNYSDSTTGRPIYTGSNPHLSTVGIDEEDEGGGGGGNRAGLLCSVIPPPKPQRINNTFISAGATIAVAADDERIRDEISTHSSSATLPSSTTSKESKNKGMTEKSSTLPLGSKSKKANKDAQDSAAKQTPTKKVFGKLFGKNKGRTGDMPAMSLEVKPKKSAKNSKSPSPDIVDFESEPRKLVPKTNPRVVLTVDKDFKDISEMEVSEEAVELAKKLRELQRQAEDVKTIKEEETKSLREVVVVGRDQEVSPPPPMGIHEDDGGYHENGETGREESIVYNKTGNGKKRINGAVRSDYGSPTVSSLDEYRKGRVGALLADHQKYTPSPQSTPGRSNGGGGSSDEDYHDRQNTSSCSRQCAESGIGHESLTSSLEDHPLSPHLSHNNEARHNEEEDDGDEEDTSMATTITTTASEMDASFMLSRSLALTEEEFSYTESFKQLKPFQFDHVDPIPEGKRERLYKVLVVGELGTGKTSIIKRYVHQFFSQHYRATIGVDFALKVLRWDPETVVRLQLWDIAGQERFGSMTRVYYKEAVGAFVVFDVTRAATLEAVPKWKADLDAKVVLPDGRPIPTVLLANKSDQPKEGIAANRDKMNEFCQQQGFSAWFQTSAKDNINIDESANFLVSKILEMDKWSQEPMANDPEKLDLSANGKHRGGGDSNCAC